MDGIREKIRKQTKKKVTRKKKKKIVMTAEQRKSKRNQEYLSKGIKKLFSDIGFVSFNLTSKESDFFLPSRQIELDHVFMKDNIIVVCEDTACSNDELKKHMRSKQDSAEAIKIYKHKFIEELKLRRPEIFSKYANYADARYFIKYLYFSFNPTGVLKTEHDAHFNELIIVEKNIYSYLSKMADTIKLSFLYEFYNFLGLKPKDIGMTRSSDRKETFNAAVIYPDDYSGLSNGVKIVSFMASAEFLLRNGYVLRKDSWSKSDGLMYQRLLEKNKVNDLRQFIAKNKEAFFNNVIIGLPEGTKLEKSDGSYINIMNYVPNQFEVVKINIPDMFNTLCIIDGQHRIFAHYQSNDSFEPTMSELRNKLHILVTGIIFPPNLNEYEKRAFESKIFLDINRNAKKVPAEIINYIESVKDPFLDTSIARSVLLQMNENGVFHNMFEFSSVQPGTIKVASIIKYGLNQLVRLSPDDKTSLYYYFNDANKDDLLNKDLIVLDRYVKFCSDALRSYFSAIREVFNPQWSKETKMLSVVSINGFILAFKDSLNHFGVQDRDFYLEVFRLDTIDFSKENFIYTSSGYNKFSEDIYRRFFQPLEPPKITLTNITL